MQDGGVGCHTFRGGHHGRQDFVVHLDALDRFFGGVRVVRRDGGYGVSLVERLMAGEDVGLQVVQRGNLFAQIQGGVFDIREIVECHHREHAVERFGGGCVYGSDMRVGVRATQHLAVQQSGGVEVGAVESAAGYLVSAVVADGAGADHVVVHAGQDHIVFVFGCRHAVASCIRAAASCTARTILS